MELYTEKYRTPKLTIAYPSETIAHRGTTLTTVWVCSEPRKYPAGQKNATQQNINWNLVTQVNLPNKFTIAPSFLEELDLSELRLFGLILYMVHSNGSIISEKRYHIALSYVVFTCGLHAGGVFKSLSQPALFHEDLHAITYNGWSITVEEYLHILNGTGFCRLDDSSKVFNVTRQARLSRS